jgi:hypothetical protein
MSPLFAFQIFGSAAILALLLGKWWLPAWRRRQAEAPLRAEIRTRPCTDFQARVDLKVPSIADLTGRNLVDLTVRGDAFEITHPRRDRRLIYGWEYCFRARETTIEMTRGQRRDWITIRRQGPGSNSCVRISGKDQLTGIWDALIRAGAQPLTAGPALSGR